MFSALKKITGDIIIHLFYQVDTSGFDPRPIFTHITGKSNGNGVNGEVHGAATSPRLAAAPSPTAAGGSLSPSMHAMPASLQKKFSRGVHYNMKLLLRRVENCFKNLSTGLTW